MTFKLPGRPSARADIHELADYLELLAVCGNRISTREAVSIMGREGEADPNVGCEDVDDENCDDVDEAVAELERRQKACNGGYPFKVDQYGNTVSFEGKAKPKHAILYCYLLLATRFNMKSSKIHAGIDGALLFEDVSAHILKHYLGGFRGRAMVFGTASGSADFPEKVRRLCLDLGEANGFKNQGRGLVTANDDKLDVVGWIPFADNTAAQVIVFGQCKTGTAWTDALCQLQPDAFIKTWIDGHILVDPIRAFFVSEAVNRARWFHYAAQGGLLFDRCRLVDSFKEMPEELFDKMLSWTVAAQASARNYV